MPWLSILALRKQEQLNLCEFKACLAYTESYTARPQLKKKILETHRSRRFHCGIQGSEGAIRKEFSAFPPPHARARTPQSLEAAETSGSLPYTAVRVPSRARRILDPHLSEQSSCMCYRHIPKVCFFVSCFPVFGFHSCIYVS